VGRVLRRLGRDTYRLPRKGPERANRVARDIPMGRLPWDETEPGHFEVDTVHHCGAAAVGEYVHTVQDVALLQPLPAGDAAPGKAACAPGGRSLQGEASPRCH